jgi:Zn-finger nucleic acid-binding protein
MTLMHEGLFEDIPLHRCGDCRALWTAPESLDRLDDNINVDASKLDWLPTAMGAAYRCPSCPGGYRDNNPPLSAITLVSSSGLIIHRCMQCEGLLLDEDSLEQIRAEVIRA